LSGARDVTELWCGPPQANGERQYWLRRHRQPAITLFDRDRVVRLFGVVATEWVEDRPMTVLVPELARRWGMKLLPLQPRHEHDGGRARDSSWSLCRMWLSDGRRSNQGVPERSGIYYGEFVKAGGHVLERTCAIEFYTLSLERERSRRDDRLLHNVFHSSKIGGRQGSEEVELRVGNTPKHRLLVKLVNGASVTLEEFFVSVRQASRGGIL